jgi:Protein of unknown function (DUF1257)
MSHFSKIKTQIRKVEFLAAALDDVGVSWKSGPQSLRGYQGETRTADVVIAQENGYDVGFSHNGQEYELVADLEFWQQNWSVDRFLNKITQRYAYHAVKESAAQQGFQVAEEHSAVDGSVRLVVQRWVA